MGQLVTVVITVKPQVRHWVIPGDLRWTQQVLIQNTHPSTVLILIPYLGNVYINEFSNHRIRKVTASTGIIITIAGTGTSSYSGDNGPATAAEIAAPLGSAVDAAGSHLHPLIPITCLNILF